MDTREKLLKEIHELVKETVPDAEETVSYGMPAFRYKGKILCYYAGFKDHVSFFPTSEPVEFFEEELKGYKTSKGTVQLPLDKPLPKELLKKMLAHRAGVLSKDAP